jgi:hemin uptake protein HemP
VRDVLRASDLLGARQVVEIEHNGQCYRLQTTKAGKLILTK